MLCHAEDTVNGHTYNARSYARYSFAHGFREVHFSGCGYTFGCIWVTYSMDSPEGNDPLCIKLTRNCAVMHKNAFGSIL